MSKQRATPHDFAAIQHHLAYDNHENRKAMLDFIANDPIYIPRYNISLETERELALQRLKKFADKGFISVFDFEKNPLNIFAGMICNLKNLKLIKRNLIDFNKLFN